MQPIQEETEVIIMLAKCQLHVNRHERSRAREILCRPEVIFLHDVVDAFMHGEADRAYEMLSGWKRGKKERLTVEDLPIVETDCGRDIRVVNYLASIGVETVGHLIRSDDEKIKAIPGIGPAYIERIRATRDSYSPGGMRDPRPKKARLYAHRKQPK